MSRYDEALRLFEELDGLEDTFIEEGMLPDEEARPIRRRRSGESWLARLAGSGWGVAAICAAVSVSVVVLLMRFGGVRTKNEGDAAMPMAPGQENNGGNIFDEKVDDAESVTEEPVTLPDESAWVPVGQISLDEFGLYYQSYGNGTCILTGYRHREEAPLTKLNIPAYSPDGDVVVAIDSYAFRNQMSLREVTLPAGLRELDHKTFPMDVPIYNLHGNVLYLGSRTNPYMVAVATADNRPGATSLHPQTRIIACHALTYDAGSYFASAWADRVGNYEDDDLFTIPSGVTHIGKYALLDVGRDITYYGYLVGWDTLTAETGCGLVRTIDGESVTVRCLDGNLETQTREVKEIKSGSTAYLDGEVFFSGYFSDVAGIYEPYYAWLTDPAGVEVPPDQFIVSGAYGDQSRVLTAEELTSVRFSSAGTADPDLLAFFEAYNTDPAALYAGKSVVMLYLRETALYGHAVKEVTVTDGRIHVTITRKEGNVATALGNRFILIPVEDPDGVLAGAAVSYEVAE